MPMPTLGLNLMKYSCLANQVNHHQLLQLLFQPKKSVTYQRSTQFKLWRLFLSNQLQNHFHMKLNANGQLQEVI